MKRIIRNITSAFALVALAASCSNSEIDELNNQPLDLPLSLSAEVSQTVTRAEAQAVKIGNIEGSIDFKLTVEGVERTMLLKSGGAVSYAEGNAPYTVSIKENEKLNKNCSITEIQNVPLTFTREGASFSFTSSLVGNGETLNITTQKQEGANRITAAAVIPMKVNCSGLYLKVTGTVPEGSYIIFNKEEYPLTSVDGGAAFFTKIDTDISANTDFAKLVISNGSAYDVQTTAAITTSAKSLYVMELSLQVQSRTISDQNTIYVAPTIENW